MQLLVEAGRHIVIKVNDNTFCFHTFKQSMHVTIMALHSKGE